MSDTPPQPPAPANQRGGASDAVFAALALLTFLAAIIVPSMLTVLVLASLISSLLLYRCAKPFINWRCRLLWEATLASPFGWWHQRYEWMMGLHIKAWADLPVEAVVLWIAVAYATAIAFETITVVLHIDKRLPEALFGRRAQDAPSVTVA